MTILQQNQAQELLLPFSNQLQIKYICVAKYNKRKTLKNSKNTNQKHYMINEIIAQKETRRAHQSKMANICEQKIKLSLISF